MFCLKRGYLQCEVCLLCCLNVCILVVVCFQVKLFVVLCYICHLFGCAFEHQLFNALLLFLNVYCVFCLFVFLDVCCLFEGLL